MSKPALGRGLGELMSGQKVPANFPTSTTSAPATENASATETTTSTTEAPTPGVDTLLRGKTDEPKATANNPFAQPTTEPNKSPMDLSFLKWILVLADVLLIVSTFFFVHAKAGKMSFLDGTLCVVMLSFAACLGCVAFFIHRQNKK